jgi:hypothetical protein
MELNTNVFKEVLLLEYITKQESAQVNEKFCIFFGFISFKFWR